MKFKAEKKANLAAASSSFSIAIDTSQIIKKIIQPDGENFSLPSCVKKVKKNLGKHWNRLVPILGYSFFQQKI